MSISLSPATRGAGALALAVAISSAAPATAAAVADGQRPTLVTPVTKSIDDRLPKNTTPFQTTPGNVVTFKVRSLGGPVFVLVSKDGDDLRDVDEADAKSSVYLREMTPENGAYVDTVGVYTGYDAFWTNTPRKYWWTAVRIDCKAANSGDDCVIEAEKPRPFEIVG